MHDDACLFPFRKRSLPFLTVDAIIGNQAFSHGRCNICSGLSYNKATFLNNLRTNSSFFFLLFQVEFTLKVPERSRVTCYECSSYERQLIIIYTLKFFGIVAD